MSKDDIYSKPHQQLGEFVFDDRVAGVFADMIQRSVPGYSTTISTISELAARFVKPDSRVYDLGCSLGAATLAMRHRIQAEGVEIIAVDNSPAMVERCQANINADDATTAVRVEAANVQDIEIKEASLVVLNFTLQFIPVAERLALLKKICDGLLPGGKLVLSEKVLLPDSYLNELNIDLHHRFKKAHGYSDLEVAQKRSALENSLIPETVDAHKQRLADAGFVRADVWYQCFNFLSIIAMKAE